MAVPNPSKELTRLRSTLQKGMPSIVFVTGQSDFFRQQAVDALLGRVPPDAELRTVDGVDIKDDGDGSGDGAAGGGAVAAELADLRGGGLFASTTFVVVRRGGSWWRKHGAAVADVQPKIQPGSALIVEASKFDKRKRAAAALYKQLASEGAVFEFRDLYDLPYDRSRSPFEGELCKWLEQCAKHLGVPLQPDAAWLVIEQVGKDPGELLAELRRLQAMLGRDSKAATTALPLSPQDLVGKLTVSFTSDPFEFTQAVLGRDRAKAWRSLQAMFARGIKQGEGKRTDTGGVLPFTASILFRDLCTVYQGRQLYDRGTQLRDLAGQLGVRQFVDQFVGHVRANDIAQLQRGFAALHACQRKIRLSGEEPQVLLERLLLQWFDGAPIETAEELEL